MGNSDPVSFGGGVYVRRDRPILRLGGSECLEFSENGTPGDTPFGGSLELKWPFFHQRLAYSHEAHIFPGDRAFLSRDYLPFWPFPETSGMAGSPEILENSKMALLAMRHFGDARELNGAFHAPF